MALRGILPSLVTDAPPEAEWLTSILPWVEQHSSKSEWPDVLALVSRIAHQFPRLPSGEWHEIDHLCRRLVVEEASTLYEADRFPDVALSIADTTALCRCVENGTPVSPYEWEVVKASIVRVMLNALTLVKQTGRRPEVCRFLRAMDVVKIARDATQDSPAALLKMVTAFAGIARRPVTESLVTTLAQATLDAICSRINNLPR